MTQIPDFEQLLNAIREIVARDADRNDKLYAVCETLSQTVPHYNWVGFYLVDSTQAQSLALGPFVGAPTEHTHIAFGQGICGQAAATEMTFVIQDVSRETNYLSCSPSVKSEIVVPIFKHGVVVGELDIDSHHLAPFGAEDRALLEAVCAELAQLF